MKVGDRVTKEKVLKVKNPLGVVEKITKEYVIVKWDLVPGQWHYTHEQSRKLKTIVEE